MFEADGNSKTWPALLTGLRDHPIEFPRLCHRGWIDSRVLAARQPPKPNYHLLASMAYTPVAPVNGVA